MKIKSITGLRGIAALVIAGFVHFWMLIYPFYDETAIPFKKLSFLHNYGDICVELFFVISGLLIAMHYEEMFLESNNKCGGVRGFLQKRSRKLYVPFIISNIVAGILIFIYWLIFKEFYIHSIDIKGAVLNFLAISQGWEEEIAEFNAVAWCVPVELLCYIVFYYLCSFARRENTDVIPLYIIMVFLGHIGRRYMLDIPFFHSGTSCRGYQSFFIGCLMWHFVKNVTEENKKVVSRTGVMILLFVIFLYNIYPQFLGDLRFVLEFIVVPTIILITIFEKRICILLELKMFQMLGSLSYEIYLFHYPVIMCWVLMNRTLFKGTILFSKWWVWMLYIGSVIIVAYIMNIYGYKLLVGEKLKDGKRQDMAY